MQHAIICRCLDICHILQQNEVSLLELELHNPFFCFPNNFWLQQVHILDQILQFVTETETNIFMIKKQTQGKHLILHESLTL